MSKSAFFKHSRGFSLLEIMAVVFLIALIASSATVMFNRGGPQKRLDNEIEAFVDRAGQIADLAIVNGESMGLVLQPPLWSDDPAGEQAWSYTWKRFVSLPDANGVLSFSWQDIENLEPTKFDTDVDIFVRIDGGVWDWEAGPISDTPLFVLYPSGEAEPFDFELEFVHQNIDIVAQHVGFTDSGRLEWHEAVEDQETLEQRLK
jgi:general secretion pathway protein H